MAKTYVDIVKYVIEIEFEIKGIVDKPDIIGAVFGQSEGLIGEDMDLRELQNSGKIGRIEIKMDGVNGKTKGTLNIPSAMDMVQTSLLAAAIETVDKVGPFEARFVTKTIQDIRNTKRTAIAERAKALLQQLSDQLPESQELAEQVRSNVRTAELAYYGPEKLPCGPDIASEDSIIIVEGRADVLNLLRHGIKNVIAMAGSNTAQSVVELCKSKTVTLFMDGDRGGELNLRRLEQLAKIDFVARAPDGKEVEELARKEIILALRKKETIEAFNASRTSLGFRGRPRMDRAPVPFDRDRMAPRAMSRPVERSRNSFDRGNAFDGMRERRPFPRDRMDYEPRGNRFDRRPRFVEIQPALAERPIGAAPAMRITPIASIAPIASSAESQSFKPILAQLKGSLKAKLLGADQKEIKEVPIRSLVESIKESKGVQSIVFDGIVTKRLVEAAKKSGVKTIVGVKKGKLDKVEGITVLTIES